MQRQNYNLKNYRPKQTPLDTSFMDEPDIGLALETLRRQVKKSDSGIRGKTSNIRSTPARRTYNAKRIEDHRSVKNHETVSSISAELQRKLYPGVKDGMGAVDRLESINTLKAITLTVSTRAIGFSTLHIYQRLYEFNNVPVRGNIYQLYRVSLAIFEAKVQIVQRAVTAITDHLSDFSSTRLNEDYLQTIKTMVALPDQLTTVFNSVGKVKIGDVLYIPKLAARRLTTSGLFIPQSENVTYSNLRDTVDALSNSDFPRTYRVRFYQHNPIPGAKWIGYPDDPVLTNADEIMPPAFTADGLAQDIECLHATMTFMNKKAPKYFTSVVTYEPDTGKGILVSNEQGTLRCPNRGANQTLIDYYTTSLSEGNIEGFMSLVPLNSDEFINGVLALLGELPTSYKHRYPTYVARDPRNCSAMSTLKYRAARDIKYT